MSFKLLFELRKRMYVTEAVWKRIPNSQSSKMKGALTAHVHRVPLKSISKHKSCINYIAKQDFH